MMVDLVKRGVRQEMPGKLLACSFCNKDSNTVRLVTAGDNANICAECAGRCKKILTDKPTAQTPELIACSFCTMAPIIPNRIVRHVGNVAICSSCVDRAKKKIEGR